MSLITQSVSYMDNQKNLNFNTNFKVLFPKLSRLISAIFAVLSFIDKEEELKTKIKSLSLDMVSLGINLKDNLSNEYTKTIFDLEKKSILLISMLDIGVAVGVISEMNRKIIKEEFQSFLFELSNMTNTNENIKNSYALDVFKREDSLSGVLEHKKNNLKLTEKNLIKVQNVSNNNYNRKDLRRSAIIDFVKSHNSVSIKDILPNIAGCSEKTLQRELIELINEGRIVKKGERRWSKYSVV